MLTTDLFGHAPRPNPAGGKLAQAFVLPPFSVLNAREGWWQERKRAWLALGIKSEMGRGDTATNGSDSCEAYQAGNGNYARTFGQDLMRGEHVVGRSLNYNTSDWVRAKIAAGDIDGGMASNHTGTSIFDPVLCELAYRWFCPPGGHVLDPFAGGSVRGVVASVLGYGYTGIDLSGEQTAANRTQAAEICIDPQPCWHTGDSLELAQFAPAPADLIFTCPPYADLERYSDDPRDLSTMEYAGFVDVFTAIIAKAAAILQHDRFACVVVGDIRDKRGNYRGLPRHTIGAFEAAGMHLYNDAVLVTSVGSLPLRTGKQFTVSRKLGKTHQNVLVFVKGNAKAAAKACGASDAD